MQTKSVAYQSNSLGGPISGLNLGAFEVRGQELVWMVLVGNWDMRIFRQLNETSSRLGSFVEKTLKFGMQVINKHIK